MSRPNKFLYLLCSNLPLPFEGIGSWTDEINYFLEKTKIIDFVLSPNPRSNNKYIRCEKNRASLIHKFLPSQKRKKFEYKSYVKRIFEISEGENPLKILVIDDLGLLKAIASIKEKLPKGSQLLYYFHGHLLILPPPLMFRVDEVFFLTKKGYLESMSHNLQFTPEVKILGNGVSSEIFYLLSDNQKNSVREKLGFNKDDILITWMANSRPVKGIHLFLKMIPGLLDLNDNIKILIIGTTTIEIEPSERVKILGVLKPIELAKFLQISDFYFFTSLWKEGFGLSLVEAIKCGNFILCPRNGGIEEVTSEYARKSFVDFPNIIQNWILVFEEILKKNQWKEIEDNLPGKLEKFYSLDSWTERMQKAIS
ncbi:MAG: glycosyltransferase family 4 protein [Flavobacteriaceae bacterium]|nr:glycosyltransferase family 4 protein [Flavobacteriaceae bacterium]